MFNTDVSNGLIKNINGFVLKECKGWTGTVALARVEALFGGSLNDLVLSAPPQLANPQSGSSESHPGVEPLRLGDRIKAKAAKERLKKKMTFSDRFSPLN